MRKLRLFLFLLCFVSASATAWAAQSDEVEKSPLLTFGAGILATFAQNDEFPTGASARVWILNQFGLEVDVFTRESNPTFTIRSFYRVLDNGIVAFYAGGGVAFFSSGLTFDSTLQITLGLEIDITRNFVFSVEVGGLFGGSAAVPVTAGAGIHYYF